MKIIECHKCGHVYNAEDCDWEPVMDFPAEREHPEYDEEIDSVPICPECYRRECAQDEAAYRRYMSGVEYVCGIKE